MTAMSSASSSVRALAGLAEAVDGERPVLLVPVPALPARDPSGAPPRITFELRTILGQTVAEAYTSRRRLVESRGHDQRWVAFPVDDTIRLLAAAGAHVLVVDPASPGGAIGVDIPGAAEALGPPPAPEPDADPVSPDAVAPDAVPPDAVPPDAVPSGPPAPPGSGR